MEQSISIVRIQMSSRFLRFNGFDFYRNGLITLAGTDLSQLDNNPGIIQDVQEGFEIPATTLFFETDDDFIGMPLLAMLIEIIDAYDEVITGSVIDFQKDE